MSDWLRVLIWLVAAGVAPTGAAGPACAVCGRTPLAGTIYLMADREENRQREVCDWCHLLTERCSQCRLPVAAGATALADGRYLCPRDAQASVLDPGEAEAVCREAREELERLLVRFLTLPGTNVTLSIEDQVHMDELLSAPGFERQCPSLLGYTRSRVVSEGRWRHSIGILGARPAAALKAVCAHEYAHAWVRENVPPERAIDRDTVEGFCELFAHQLCVSLDLTRELEALRRNGYSRGQIDLFVEAERTYGLHTVLEWMKHGVDGRLLEDDLDRIRHIEVRARPDAGGAAWAPPPPPMPTPVPDELTLVGISGTGRNRLALINDRSFGEGETARVRVGASSASVRCVEIRADSVRIRVDGAESTRELRLRTARPAGPGPVDSRGIGSRPSGPE